MFQTRGKYSLAFMVALASNSVAAFSPVARLQLVQVEAFHEGMYDKSVLSF
jgi:hypothetical protein